MGKGTSQVQEAVQDSQPKSGTRILSKTEVSLGHQDVVPALGHSIGEKPNAKHTLPRKWFQYYTIPFYRWQATEPWFRYLFVAFPSNNNGNFTNILPRLTDNCYI